MVQLIAFIILFGSLLGILFILLKKIPSLVQLPQQGLGMKDFQSIRDIRGRIGDAYTNFFEKQMLLHRLLSKLKVFVLKMERTIDASLHGIRKKTQEAEKKARRKQDTNTPIV